MVHIDVVPWAGFREPFSSLSHLTGAIVFACLAYNFVRRGRGERVRQGSLFVFAMSSVLMMICSGVYHFSWPGPVRDVLFRCDLAGIFVLIAASMTPVHAILFKGVSRWIPLCVIWSVAMCGIFWTVFGRGLHPGAGSVIFFLLFGWGGTVTAWMLALRFGWAFIFPVFLSGISYTLGAIVLVMHRLTLVPGIVGPHEIWHVMVLIGLGLHWYFVNGFATLQVGDRPATYQIPRFRLRLDSKAALGESPSCTP